MRLKERYKTRLWHHKLFLPIELIFKLRERNWDNIRLLENQTDQHVVDDKTPKYKSRESSKLPTWWCGIAVPSEHSQNSKFQ